MGELKLVGGYADDAADATPQTRPQLCTLRNPYSIFSPRCRQHVLLVTAGDSAGGTQAAASSR